MNTIHTRIKQRREALGITMKGLADLVGVSAWQTVQQWEREDGTAPKRDRLAAVADALRTTPEELLFGSEAPGHVAVEIENIDAKLSAEALRVARAFDRLKSEKEKESVLSLLRAFNVI